MINLYINYYKDSNARRQAELERCILANLKNELINTVIFESQNRMNYSDYFNKINLYTNDNDVNIIANLDIYFDHTVDMCNNITVGEFWALARWNVDRSGSPKHFGRPDSQDAWVFRGRTNIAASFPLGMKGCDNRLAHEAKVAGYKVKNPSLTIMAYHLHNSGIRNYSGKAHTDTVPGPYLTVEPSKL